MPTRPERRAPARLTRVAGVVLLVLACAPYVGAQTPYIPYFGKNQIRYDRFEWYTYNTDHFEIYYYTEIEPHLERVASYAESAYQKVSSDLKHDLAFRVPLVLFATHSEFEQQNIIPGAAQEGVAAFAEPSRDRMVLPIDEPPDRLYGLIVHELTHIFEFDIIPTSLIRRDMPLWINEGLSDYERGDWQPIDLATVRDAAVADIVPKMSELQGYGDFNNPRIIYNLGHAVFEFIESRWGKEGIRQFLFSLRKSVIGGGEDAFQEALGLEPDEFDQQFEKYLKDRFKPFRDKERPADYGRDLAPNPQRSRYTSVLSVESSPSGDLLAAMVGNRKDRELDIVLLSTKDGAVVRNLTSGFDKDKGFEYISFPSEPSRFNAVSWMSWSPNGDRLAYFVRTEKDKTLILQNVVSGRIEQRIAMRTIDEPESPDISPDGRTAVFAGLQNALGDIFLVDLTTSEITNLTRDELFDYAPTFSPDGKFLVYAARISWNQKLFKLDLETKQKTQITFGTHDDGGAQFIDIDNVVFASTATDPTQPIEADIARNGNIYNIWTLNLRTGELRQWTDALGGNTSPVVLGGSPSRIAFVSYDKGEYGLHVLDRREPLSMAASSDFGSPGPVIDFQAPLQHTLIADNKRKKGKFEKLFLEGRPPVALGVTTGGDVFGGTSISFTDVLGDQQFNMFAASVSQYRTLSFSYLNLSQRFQWAAQGYSQTQFFYGQYEGLFYDPAFAGIIDRDLALATRSARGGTFFGIYPFNRYARVELSAGIVNYAEEFEDPALQEYSEQYQQDVYGTVLFRNGTFVPFGVSFIQETTVFREFGPLAGNTVRVSYEIAPDIGGALSRQTLDVDARYYLRLGGTGLLALRGRGFTSWGEAPDFLYFGGNSEMRGYDYLQFLGQNAFFGNAELRFPLIEAMLTPLGVMGGVRGLLFFNVGIAGFDQEPVTFWENDDEVYTPVVGYDVDANGNPVEVLGAPRLITGFRLKDSRASYGIGLETFALGFPIHFDWSWRTLFNRDWEDALFALQGGSEEFRQPRFDVWIGYDF
jgi:WD40 repeat protein